MIAHTDVYMENLRSMRTLSDLRSKCTDLMLNVPQPIDSTDVTSCVPNKKKAKEMKRFIIFPEILGSDQLYIGDGRWSESTLINVAREHAKNLNKNLNKGIKRIQLCSGSLLYPVVLKEFSLDN